MSWYKTQVGEWSRQLRHKSWVFEDIISPSSCNNLILLLNSFFPKNYQHDLFHLRSQETLPLGFHFLFNNQPNIDLGLDGYDNYQAPVIGGRQIYQRRMWVKGLLEYEKMPKLNHFLACRESINSTRVMGNNAFVETRRDFLVENEFQFRELRALMYTNESHRPISSSKVLPSDDDNLFINLSFSDILRYSFLTYNCHRVHYDQTYCRERENLPTIIVQGPFMVTILLHWFRLRFPTYQVKSFRYKNRAPWFSGPALINCYHLDSGFKLFLVSIDRHILLEGIIK